MVKSVMINDDVHRTLLRVQTMIYERKRVNVNLGDIVGKLLDKAPEEITDEIVVIIETTNK